MSVASDDRADGQMGDLDAPIGDPAPAVAKRDAPLSHWVRRAALGDLVAAGAGATLASFTRFGWEHAELAQHHTISYTGLGVVIALGWPLLGAACGTYELRTALFGVEELRRVLRTGVMLVAALGMAHFIFKLDLSRGYVGALVPFVLVLTALWRLVLRSSTSSWMNRGSNHHKAVAVGPAAELARLCLELGRPGDSPIDIVAFVADDLSDSDPAPPPLDQLKRLPSRNAIEEMAADGTGIDLLVRAGRPHPDELSMMSQRAHRLGASVAIAPHRKDSASNVAFSYVPLGSTPLLMVETPALRPPAAALKSVLDRVMALVLLVVLSPALIGIAAVLASREGRPVLFKQQRVGRNGKCFTCIKFRTMTRDAEEQLPDLVDLNEAGGPLFKVRNDPRVTKTGCWLRRHSLDELPQLWNVLAGDMSIVGPRPALPGEVATFDQHTSRRLLVKPGITGLWQTEGRSDLPWDEGVYLDLMYVDHWSPLLDWVIMARTAKIIIRPEGAY